MVNPIILDRCVSVLSVCDIGVLWPNGWMNQDATWYGGRPRRRRHCVRLGPRSPLPLQKRGTAAPTVQPMFIVTFRVATRNVLVTAVSVSVCPLLHSHTIAHTRM